MKKTNKKSGISLIVLVITIIVIIILAVAVILTLANNNPIENAKQAVSANDQAVIKEEAALYYADWYTKKNLGNLEDEYVGKSAEEYVKAKMAEKGYKQEVLDKISIEDDGKITIESNTEEAAYPVIPNGFEYLTGTVETGYVIKNSTDGNEFVWIPIDIPSGKTFEEVFVIRGSYFSMSYIDDTQILSYVKEPYPTEKKEYDAMVASVQKYGGFYIGRYEASKNSTTNKAQSVADQNPWVNITWGASMTNATGGAVEKARAVYPESVAINDGDPVSTLTYGVQWDAAVLFIQTNYPGIWKDSIAYGNFDNDTDSSTYTVINTGSNSEYSLNNIYDIAGNVEEWSMESVNDQSRVQRGGDCSTSWKTHGISSRFFNSPSSTTPLRGFRLALYVK